MVTQGFILLGMGMGFVFLFLVILIFGMKAMSAIIIKFFPDKAVPVQTPSKGSVDTEVAVAIAAAKAYSQQ